MTENQQSEAYRATTGAIYAQDSDSGSDEFVACGKSHSFCTVGGGSCKIREGHVTDHVCDKCGKTF